MKLADISKILVSPSTLASMKSKIKVLSLKDDKHNTIEKNTFAGINIFANYYLKDGEVWLYNSKGDVEDKINISQLYEMV